MAEEDKWMLEIDLDDSTTADYQYWLHAVEAARQAGAHALEESNGATASWAEVVRSSTTPSKSPTDLKRPRQVCHPPMLDNSTEVTKKPECMERAKKSTPQTTRPRKRKATSGRVSNATKVRPARRNTKTSSFPPLRTNVCSKQAEHADDSNLLRPFSTLTRNDKRQVKQAFAHRRMLKMQKSTDLGRPVVAEESALYRYRTHTMTQSEFQRLEKSQWLSDATINMFLQAYVTDKIDRAHCFSSHFFTQLLSAHPADPCELASDDNEETGGPGVENQFNYQAVQNYSNACGGLTSNGLFTLDNLLIPAHVDGNHWIILRVNFEEKRIELYDSMGTVNPTYNRLLDALRRYIYCELHKHLPEHSWPQYSSWSSTWSMRNASRQSPRQHNGYDCGVFTMISGYLLARGVQLSRTTYDQAYVDSSNLRHNIALALLSINELPDPVSGQPRLPFRTSTPSTRRKRKSSTSCTTGGKKLRANSSSIEVSPSNNDTTLLNRKRSAKSLTDADPNQRSLTDCWTARTKSKRRKKNEV